MERKTKKIILICIAAVAAILLLAALVVYLIFQSQFALYKDAKYGFSIKYPKEWQKVVEPQPQAAVVFTSPQETALDTFFENVNISVEPLPGGISNAQSLIDRIVLQMTKVFKNVQVSAKKPVTFGGLKGYAVVFAAEKPRSMRILNVVTVKGAERGYILTYIALTNRYQTYLPLIMEMMRSFRFE